MTTSFQDLFPEIMEEGRKLYTTFSTVSAVIIFAGLLTSAANGSYGDLSRALRGVITAALVVVMIGIFPQVMTLFQEMTHSLVEEVGADPAKAHEEFAHLVAGPDVGGNEEVGFFDILWDGTNGGIGKAILYAFVFLFSKVALAITWLAFLVENAVVVIGTAVAPVFLGMLTLEATRGIAARFFLTLLATLCWPLGWALSSIITRGILRMAANNNIYSGAGDSQMLAGTEVLFFIVVISLWICGSTLGSPWAVHKMVTTGAQFGSSILQSVATATSQGISYGVGAGVTSHLGGNGTVSTALTTAAGGLGGFVAGASGSSGVLVPAVIGTMAIMASSKEPEAEAEELATKLRKSS